MAEFARVNTNACAYFNGTIYAQHFQTRTILLIDERNETFSRIPLGLNCSYYSTRSQYRIQRAFDGVKTDFTDEKTDRFLHISFASDTCARYEHSFKLYFSDDDNNE